MNLSFQAHFKEIFIGVPWRPRHGGEREKKNKHNHLQLKVRKAMDSSAGHFVKAWKELCLP